MFYKKRRNLLKGVLTAAILLAAPYKAAAETEQIRLTIASSHPTTVPWVGTMKNHVVPESNRRLEAMGSKYRIKWTESYGGALFKYDKTLEAVSDGLTDIGWVGTMWEESKMPLHNISFYTPFISDDLPSILKLMNELHKKIPALTDSWDKHNQVYLGASGIETYHLLTKKSINTLEDLVGLKIISAGSVGNWLKGTGATPVNSGLPSFYNLLKTGVADGVLISFSGAYPFKLFEVAPHVTKVSIGAQITGAMTINKRIWKKLPTEVQQVLAELGNEYSEIHAKKLMQLANAFEQKMIEAGATVTTLDESERDRWVLRLPDLSAEWRDISESKAMPADEVLNAYLQGVEQLGIVPARNWGQ